MKIALCNDIFEFGGNRLADRRWAGRFPGAGWASVFFELAAQRGWEVASGEIALSHVQCGYWRADEVLVVQELDSAWGARLREAGCRPLLLTCLESPLYASLFFDRWQSLAASFRHYMVPASDAARADVAGHARGWPLRFPCYWQQQRSALSDWATRPGDVVLVAANKYWSHEDLAAAPSWTRPRSYIQWRRHDAMVKASPSRRQAQRQQLHDARLEAITALSAAGMLDLYGSGWDRLSVLPRRWQQRLADVSLPYRGKAADKHQLQSGFKFALCFENVSAPGYVTEKIIEALVAGAIPVYLGAPDIADHVPANAFIDAGRLASMAQLPETLNAVSAQDAARMIAAGQDFLDSEAGRMHAYEGFADWVATLAQEATHVV
ncbi:hypothetical protein J8I26_09720 [Herbaspirillum sp. LeCh32-8]|uniref:glycosyltransferase family 10 domain-containing protein n=1 Tax=Herbaspirillum sp. LeCh32-8 TaxID=2821356 RepID=UPI001AE4132A|nr:glycosyltransferase family 10 [Herbaspirillum sp. LeCh32-8]MBP0598381.1 hypothetical protein [Herbaspirillum sp. LeCh32-8]